MTQTFAKLKIVTPKAMALKLGRPRLQLKAQLRIQASLSAVGPILLSPAYAISLDLNALLASLSVSTLLGSVNPLMDGVAAAGVATAASRTDHVHPTDTTRAPLASPAFTGVPTTAATPAALDNSLKLATTAYADAATATLSGTVTTALALKAPLASPALTGVPTGPTAAAGNNSTQLATTAYLDAKLAVANGIATLDGGGKLTAAQIPASLIGAVVYQGTWNASTNSPALASGVGTKGFYYKVGTAGATTIDGNNQWLVGDTIIFDGATWDKIDGVANEVISVAGLFGVITSAGLKTALAIGVADVSGAAPLASPTFTGVPAGPTAAANNNTTQFATTAYADAADALRAPLASPTFTGVPAAPTAAPGTNTTQLATTAYVLANSVSSGAPYDAEAYNNILINGGMEVDQANVGASTTVAATYAIDGWIVSKGGTMVCAAQQVADAPAGFSSSLKVTVSTAEASIGASDFLVIEQPIEGYRASKLAFGTASAQSVVIGFWTKIHRTGAYSGSLRNFAATRSYPFSFTQNVADTWEYKTITVPGDTAGAWVGNTNAGSMYLLISMAAGSTFTGAAAAWAASQLFGVTGTTNGVAAVTDVFQITGVSMIAGTTVPTSAQSGLLKRSFDQELLLCQRYYSKSFAYGTVPANAIVSDEYAGFAFSAAGMNSQRINFPSRMRATPTMTFFSCNNKASPTAGQWQYYTGSVWSDVSSFAIGNSGGDLNDNSFVVALINTVTAAAAYIIGGAWVANARL